MFRERERERDRREIEVKEQLQREMQQRENLEKIQRDTSEREKQAYKDAVIQQIKEELLRTEQLEELLRNRQFNDLKGTPPTSSSRPPSSGGPGTDGLSSHPIRPSLLMPVAQHSESGQNQRDKDNWERFLAAVERDRDSREKNSGPPVRHTPPPSYSPSSSFSGSDPYRPLPRADLSASIQGYQRTPSSSSSSSASPTSKCKKEPQQSNSHLASNVQAEFPSWAGDSNHLKALTIQDISLWEPSGRKSNQKRSSQSPSSSATFKCTKSDGSFPVSVVDEAAHNDSTGKQHEWTILFYLRH